MDASGLWDVMDTSLVPRDEIELLARMLIDSMRKQCCRRIADKFVSEAKLEHVEEEEGSLSACVNMVMERGSVSYKDPWVVVCHERLKLKRSKEDTCQGTQTLNSDQDDVVISDAKRAELRKLCNYIFEYIRKNSHLLDAFDIQVETDEAQPQDGSRKCKSSGEEPSVKKMDCGAD